MLYITTAQRQGVPETVFWKEVEEGWIRYDQCSGSTHLLSPLARFVIDIIDKSPHPLSFSEVVDEVLHAEPDAEAGDCDVEVKNVLRLLSNSQFIQSVPP